jgi:fibronectin type 3 domain-containing protein
VDRSTDGGNTWVTLASPATTTYSNIGLTADTSYEYRVTTLTANGNSAPSTVVTATTVANPPSSLTATSTGATVVHLTWPAVTHATTYKLERSPDGNTWTTLSPNPALTGSSTSYNDTTAIAGTSYYYRISTTDASGTSIPSSLASVTTLPATPVLMGTVASSSQINLTWATVPTAFSYKPEYSLNGTNWFTLSTQAGTTFSDTGLAPNTAYNFRLSAINGTGTSALSTTLVETTLAASPTGLTAAAASTTSIALSWVPVTSSTGYKLERSLDNTTWTTVTPATAFTHASVGYTDTGLTAGTTYYYRLSAITATGTSTASAAVNAKTLSVAPTVTGTVTSDTALALSWPAVTGATAYKIEGSDNGGLTWTTLVASQATLTYAATGLTGNSTEEYRVSSISVTGVSAPSTVVTLTTLISAPTGLVAAATSPTDIHITWPASNGATGYKLERSLDGTTFTTITPATAFTGSSVSYDDTTVLAGTTYYYRLSAISASGTSAASAVVHALTFPAAPSITATTVSASAITISWAAVTGASTYMVEVSANGGSSWSTLAASQAALTYPATGLSPDTSYKFRVTSINNTGDSAASTIATGTTLLTAPTNLAATAASATSVSLIWTPVTDATSYLLERSVNNTTWATITPTTPFTGASASYTDATALAGTTYYYRLSAIDAVGTSVPATAVTVLTDPAAPTLTGTVTSATAVSLTWTASTSATSYVLQRSVDGGTTWTNQVTQSTLTYPQTSLTGNTAYKYRVLAVNTSGSSAPSTVLSLTTFLAAPVGLTATPTTATSIALAWTASTGATTYKLERSPDGNTWSTLSPSPALTGSSTSYTDTTVLAGTSYTYRLSATNALATSVPSATATALTVPAQPVLTAAANSTSQITLTWPAVTGANNYKLEFSTDGGTTWNVLNTQSTVGYVHTGLVADTTYKYRLTAIDNTGNSVVSAVVTQATLLAPPATFTATGASATSIALAWQPVTDATTYKIERSPDGSTWTALTPATALTGTSSSYTDATVLPATSYYYEIFAVNANGTSLASPVSHVLTVPAASVLTASLVSSTQINLTWTAITGATGYQLYSSTDSVTWTPLTLQTGLTFNNIGLTPDTHYQYRVYAIDAAGPSAVSNTTASVTTLLPSPASFAAAVTTSTNINLTWAAVTDATSYKIERSPDNTTWTALTPSPALTGSSVAYSDTTVVAGTQYYYRISATNTNGSSAPSAVLRTMTLTATPTLTAAAVSATQVNLSWNAVTGASSYKLETSLDGGTTWSTLASPSITTYSVTGLTADTSYEYRVSGVDATGPSVASTVQTVSAFLAPPSGFTAVAASPTSVTLGWSAETDATTYKIERSADDATWSAITPATALTQSSDSYTDASVSAGTNYYYRVSGVDAAGTSLPTAVAHVLTTPATPALAGTVFSSTEIDLTWNAVKAATSYTLQTFDGTNWNTITPGPVGTATSFSDTALTPDTPYIFRIYASDGTGAGLPSAVSVNLTTKLSAPASFVATPLTATSIGLAWTVAPDAVSYLLQRSTDNVNFTTIVPSPALTSSSHTYTDSTVLAGTTYYYRLTAIDASGNSAPASSSALTLPPAPILSGTPVSATQLNLTWPAVSSATSYTLKVSDGSGGWTTVSPGPVGAVTSFSITGLSPDTAYTYELIANNATGASPASTSTTVTTTLGAPAAFTAASTSAAAVTLAFSVNGDATSYLLQRSPDNTIWTTLTPSPALGTTSTGYTDTTVQPGTLYYYRLYAINSSGTSVASTANILTRPAAPTLTGTASSSTSISLAWTPVKSATSYQLQSFDGTNWNNVSPGPVGNVTGYSVTGLNPDTVYTYRLTATNTTGVSAVSTSLVLPTELAAPASFVAAASSATSVTLGWTAIPDATSYLLQRSSDNILWTTITPSPALGASSATYTDTTVSPGTTYYYKLTAIDAAGNSVAATASALTKPAAPVLTAEVVSATSLFLSWTRSLSATGYLVESYDGTNWNAVTPGPVGTANTLTLTGLAPDTAYTYRVTAINGTGNSTASTSVVKSTLLGAPASFTAAATSATAVHLAWTAYPDATGYLLERSVNGTIWTALVPSPALGASSASYSDTTAQPGTSYQYRLSAIDAAGTSVPTAAATVLTDPASPTLTGVAASATEIDLSWTPVLSATSYTLESYNGTTWSAVSPAPVGTATSIALTGLAPNTAYTFRIEANNNTGASANGTPLVISTLLGPPTNFTAVPASSASVTLGWTAINNATTYLIERSNDDATWTALTPATALIGTSAAYTDTTVVPGTSYYYRISAVDAQGTSSPSTGVPVITPLVAPTGLVATANSATQITVTWSQDTASALTGYRLEDSLDSTTWTAVASVGPSTTSAVVTGLTTATAYHFRLFALDGNDSAPSTTASATTM